jgi:hypothetical protein
MELMDASLKSYHLEIRPVVIAFYTESCCAGNTLNNKLVRKATIDKDWTPPSSKPSKHLASTHQLTHPLTSGIA